MWKPRTPAMAALTLAFGQLFAQSQPARPKFEEFEVAVIVPTPPEWASGRYIKMESANRFLAKNHTLKTPIAAAYNLSPKVISGGPSAWLDSVHFDILAKTPGAVRPNLDEQMFMLRKLLADRFKLTFHRETKEMPIFAMTVAKNGSKLKESTISVDAVPSAPPLLAFVIAPHLVRLPGRNATMLELAPVMQRAALDRPVVDQTGMSGRYDFDLEFTPDESLFGGVPGKPPNPDSAEKPGLLPQSSNSSG